MCDIREFVIAVLYGNNMINKHSQLCFLSILQKALGAMGDVTWCPRCNSVVIQEPEEHLKLAQCTNCMFSFCTECMEMWHQVCLKTVDHHGQQLNTGMSGCHTVVFVALLPQNVVVNWVFVFVRYVALFCVVSPIIFSCVILNVVHQAQHM